MRYLDTERSSATKRIERRLEVLNEWLREGIPPEYVLPQSLTEVRQWNVPSLGIQPISSPNAFTKTHPVYGKNVQKIAECLTSLRDKYAHPAERLKRRRTGEDEQQGRVNKLKDQLADAEDQLTMVAGQWYAERRTSNRTKELLGEARDEIAELEAKVAEKDHEIAELKRRLSSGSRLRVIE